MNDMSSELDGAAMRAGDLLRQARESQGVTIDALAATIKVPVAKLQALESGDLARMPDSNLNRALAMTVCRFLKIDSAPILALMPAAVAITLASTKPPLNQPFRDFAHTGLTFESSSPLSLRVPKLSSAVLAPLVLLMLAAGVYLMPEKIDLPEWLVSRSAEAPASTPAGASSVELALPVIVPVQEMPAGASAPVASGVDMAASASSSAAQVVAVTASAAASQVLKAVATAASAATSVASVPSKILPVALKPIEAASQVAAAKVVPSAPSVAASAPSGIVAKLSLSSKLAAWVEVVDASGQKVFSRQLAAGERVEVQGRPPLKVVAGNAPSVSILFNGQPVDLAAITRQNVARIELK